MHLARVVGGGERRHGDRGDLTRAARGPGGLEGRQEVDTEDLGRLVGAGAEQHPVRVGEDREGPHLGPTDLVRQRGAEGELGR